MCLVVVGAYCGSTLRYVLTLITALSLHQLPRSRYVICPFTKDSISRKFSGAYGEAEFIFASIKVITIVGLIILGIVIDLGGGALLVRQLLHCTLLIDHRPEPRPPWVQILERPRSVRAVSRHSGFEGPVPGLVGGDNAGCVLLHWH